MTRKKTLDLFATLASSIPEAGYQQLQELHEFSGVGASQTRFKGDQGYAVESTVRGALSRWTLMLHAKSKQKKKPELH